MHEKNSKKTAGRPMPCCSLAALCYRNTNKTHFYRSNIQKLNIVRQHICVLQRMALRLSGRGFLDLKDVPIDARNRHRNIVQMQLPKGTATSRENRKEHSGLGEKCGTESKGRIQGNLSLHQAS